MLSARETLSPDIAARICERALPIRGFFEREATRLAKASREVAQRFLRGGQLYAFGRGPYATDAAHLSVEFVHPVIVGKRALPAFDVSAAPVRSLEVLLEPDDIAIGLGPPECDPEVIAALQVASSRGALTFALPGAVNDATFAFAPPTCDAHVDQEIFEVLGHTLYESVHVFLEHRDVGEDVGPSAFLYPFLMGAQQETEGIVADVAASIREKAEDSCRLREQVAQRQAERIAAATRAIADRLEAGGRLLIFGNGGSSTDANDFALDCMDPGIPAIRAISLASEAAILSAVANDVGTELMFLRQIVARARPNDVAFALSTSGGSKNVVAALEEARKRGMLVVALLGYDGGEIVRRGLADHAIVVDAEYIPRIQEVQGAVYHAIREFLV